MIQKKFRFQIILKTNLTIRSCSQQSCHLFDLFDKDFSLLYLYFGEYVFLTKTFKRKLCSWTFYRPQSNFPSGNIPTVQFPKLQLHKFVLAAALGPPTEPCGASEYRTFGNLSLGKLNIWKLETGEIVTWKDALWKYIIPIV